MFRPETMAWIDVLVDPRFAAECLHHLGAHRLIELRPYDRDQTPFEVEADEGLSDRLLRVREALDRYEAYLPVASPPAATKGVVILPTKEVLPRLEETAAAWIEEAKPVIRRLESVLTRLDRFRVLEQCLRALPDDSTDMRHFTFPESQQPFHFVPVIALARSGDEALLTTVTRDALLQIHPMPDDADTTVWIGVVNREALDELERTGHAHGVRFAHIPNGLSGSPREAASQLERMIEDAAQSAAGLRAELDAVGEHLDLPGCLWFLRRHLWVQGVMRNAMSGVRFVWLGGWTVARRHPKLVQVLEDSGVPFLLNRDDSGEHGEPPIELSNPRWIRKFEVFARGFGMPSRNEVDPSPLLAAATPLMFGYMFGDVGQGLVVAAVAWLLRRRLPVLSLLVPAGLLSVVFGFLFGSLFCNEHLLPALWLRPMDDPMTLLLTPVIFGFLFILTGMSLSGLQAHWSGAGGRWWSREFPVVLMYSGLPLVFWHTSAALWCGGTGVGIYLAAGWRDAFRQAGSSRALLATVAALLELVETLAQLLINTVSFARLGAFALAHAGLGAAVITLAAIPDSTWASALILVLGNALVIALEGLIVSIQTTRLVMFEFFRRFYTGSGREFRPLAVPDDSHPQAA